MSMPDMRAGGRR